MYPFIYIIEIILYLAIISASFLIFKRTRKLFVISEYEGIGFFSGAFLLFLISFSLKLIFGYTPILELLVKFNVAFEAFRIVILVIIDYLFILGVAYLVYSMIWKELGKRQRTILNVIALGVAVIGNLVSYLIVPLSVMTMIFYSITVSYANYRKLKSDHKKNDLSELFLISLSIIFFNQIIILVGLVLPQIPHIDTYSIFITAITFAIFQYLVSKTIKWQRKENASK